MPNRTAVYRIGGKSYVWIRCETTWVLMVQNLNHLKYEWEAVGEVILRQVYENVPAAWAAVIFTDSGKHHMGTRLTQEDAWDLVEQAYDRQQRKTYSSETVQSPSDGSSSTS